MAAQRIVYVDNSILLQLARNSEAVREFPFLRELLTVEGCGSCGAARENHFKRLAKAKKRVAGLAGSRGRVLKALLKADLIRVIYTTGEGTSRTVEF